MGILLMNIVAFAMPQAAYFNPHAYGGAAGADLAVYLVNFVLFDGKMRGLFSFLFGASMLLVIDRAEAKGESAVRVHYARMLTLLAFGLAHLWLVWWGDILNLYALIGMIAFAFRRTDTPRLVGLGAVLVLAQCLLDGLMAGSVAQATADLRSADPNAAHAAAATLAGFARGFGVPSPAAIAADLSEHRGSWSMIGAARWREEAWSPLRGLLLFGWETLGYMLLGMAAFRGGLLTGGWSRAAYVRWMKLGFAIGVPGYAALALWLVATQFSLVSTAVTLAVATLLRPPMILAWACLILLAMRPGGTLTMRVAAAGRMAFTNYLATSLICTTLFYGYGFGLYGTLSRWQLYPLVALVCAAMLLWSKPWLESFRYGPFEWLWRSFARGRLQPMRK
ncbi:MAG: DUF418 domain-containing protein [Sphingomonas sp.]|nr:DUF418 domain-containing protein [Sphingomonas sp.]